MTRSEINEKKTQSNVWQQFLDRVRANKKCMACDRAVHGEEEIAIEKYVSYHCVGQFWTLT